MIPVTEWEQSRKGLILGSRDAVCDSGREVGLEVHLLVQAEPIIPALLRWRLEEPELKAILELHGDTMSTDKGLHLYHRGDGAKEYLGLNPVLVT